MERVEILAGLLNRIGNFDISKFKKNINDRILLQKTVYFLQVFGLNLGYYFNWYIYGPYSKTLADDGYNKLENALKKVPSIQFGNRELGNRFDKLVEFLGNRGSDSYWLELLASIHFLKRLGKSKESIVKTITTDQKHFKINEFEEAWYHSNKFNIL